MQPSSGSSQKARHAAWPRPLRGLRLLVVEDNAEERELLVALLASAGAEIRAVASVDRALATLASWRPDVLVSDLGLQGDSGYRLIRTIRSMAGPVSLPAIAVTGQTSSEDRAQALRAGFQAHLAKPVDTRHLLAAIAHLAANRRGRNA